MSFDDVLKRGIWQRLVRRLYVLAVGSVLIGVVTAAVMVRFVSDAPGPGPRFLPYVLTALADKLADPAAAAEEARRLREDTALEVSVYDDSDRLLVTNVEPPRPPPAPAQRRDVVTRFDGAPLGGIVVPMHTRDGRVVWASANLGPPAPGKSFAVLVVAILLVLAFVAVAFTTWLARPLGELAKTAELFGKGDVRARADVKKAGAFDGLARAFNEMANRITASMSAEKELLANVSHELRTPLSRIKVALDLADEGDAELARESLRDIAEDLSELEHIIDDVLTAARLDKRVAGALPPLHLMDVPLSVLVDKAASRFRAQHPQHVLAITGGVRADDADDDDANAKGEANHPPLASASVDFALHADAALLRRALDNVLDNAAKYSDKGSTVTLVLEHADAGASVAARVIDRGVGMSADDLAQLFTPFFRAEKSRTRMKGGVGLGLVLARRIVEAHGGRVEVASAPGAGTTVSLIIPATRA